MRITILTLLLCNLLITACSGGTEKTSGKTTIATSEIGLEISAQVFQSGASTISVFIKKQGTSSQVILKLGGGDQLTLMVDGTENPLEEIFEPANLFTGNTQDYYYYRLSFTEDISRRDMTLLFSRPDAQDAESPVQFGTPPDIITPLPSDVFSVSTDDIYVTFPPNTTGPDSMTTFISDSCRREVSDTNPLTTTLILHPTTYNCASNTAHIRISRSWYPAIAPTLNQTLSYTRTRINKQITLQYFP